MKKKLQRFCTQTHQEAGFTLVELIVVIAILAILAGIAVPAYSGYIDKANEAADQQLLDTINNAFVAACMEKGYNPYDLPVEPTLNWKTTPITVALGNDNAFAASFDTFFAGNEDNEFTVFEAINYNAIKGMFVSGNVLKFTYNGVEVTIDAADIEAFQNSNWGTIASKDLLTLVGNVSEMAQGIDNDVFLEMLGNEAYLEASAAVLGWSADEYDAKFSAALEEAGEAWLAENPGGDVEAYKETLGAQMVANNTILVAAKGAETTGSSIIELLTTDGGKTAKESIKTSMATDPSAGLSQAALAYGLYSSFMLEKDPDNFDPDAPLDFSAVMNTMEDPDFQTYLTEGNGQKDLEGYLAALGAVSDNSGAGGIGTDILTDGFNNEELATLMQQAMGK